MTAAERPRYWSSPSADRALDRRLVIFHYEHALRQGEPAFSVATVEKKSFGRASVSLALLSSQSRHHEVLYSVCRSEALGFLFRRLHPDADGVARLLFDAARSDDIASLSAVGLSYREIGAVTGESLERLQKLLGGA